VGVIGRLVSDVALRGSVRLPSSGLVFGNAHRFDFFALGGLTWIDWASVLGLFLTVVGFGITWWQLHRTRTARQAVSDTQTEIDRETASTGLGESLPLLKDICAKARAAAGKRDRKDLRRRLENWSDKCGEAITQLQQLYEQQPKRRRTRAADDRVADVVQQLRSARSMVREALWKMDDQPQMEDLELGVRYALRAMSEFSDLATEMIEERRYYRSRKAS
jgi:hypothetical protein